ncbi:uncharacterized protein FFNC_05770 [Fusarium fujikuroi]|nr:uncharacterized protein FFNC_05770 [Fusarium fujikuroi]SCV54510.1 uncharacterized protein FFB14_13644 [Fusarium fujikuroi]
MARGDRRRAGDVGQLQSCGGRVDKQAKFIWNQSWMALPHSTHGGHTQKRAVNEC